MFPLLLTNREEKVCPKKFTGKLMGVEPVEPSSLCGRTKLSNPVRIAPPEPLGPGTGTVKGKTFPLAATVPVKSDSVTEGTERFGNKAVNERESENVLLT